MNKSNELSVNKQLKLHVLGGEQQRRRLKSFHSDAAERNTTPFHFLHLLQRSHFEIEDSYSFYGGEEHREGRRSFRNPVCSRSALKARSGLVINKVRNRREGNEHHDIQRTLFLQRVHSQYIPSKFPVSKECVYGSSVHHW